MAMTDYDRILWNKINRGSDTECWPWQGPVNERGRGVLKVLGKNQYAHRVTWQLTRGQTLQGCNWVEQTCKNNRCCNPRHLRVRPFRGASHPSAKLTEDAAKEIYDLFMSGQTQSQIAAKFGVGQKTVCKIVNGTTWRHINFR